MPLHYYKNNLQDCASYSWELKAVLEGVPEPVEGRGFKPKISVKQLLSNPSDRPRSIARILPQAKVYIVARFRNRQDADEHKRVLRRFIPSAVFEIIFDPPNDEEQDHQALQRRASGLGTGG